MELYNVYPDYERDWYFDKLYNKEEYNNVKDNNYEEVIDENEYDDEEEFEYYQRNRSLNDRIIEDIDFLLDKFISNDEDKYCIEMKDYSAILILMLDGNIRYEWSGDDLLKYTLQIFFVDIYEPQ
jgi:hypothetical protein